MAETYELTLRSLLDLNNGQLELSPPTLTGTPVYSRVSQVLANGDNSFTVPTGANFCLIVFSPTSITTKTLKGVGGDTGIILGAGTKFTFLPVRAGDTFIINSSALDTGLITEIHYF